MSSRVSFAAIVLGAVLLASCNKAKPVNPMMAMMMAPPPVRTVEATSGDVPLTANAVGTVEAIHSVDVKSRVAGQILRVQFAEGQNVERGQVLFEIDPEPFQRQIAQIEADLAKDQAMERQSRANVARDEAQFKQAQASADRALALAKDGIYSKEQTEQVVATADAARASLQADKAAVDSAVQSIQSDRARLAQTQLQLTYTTITAPITGRAGAISLKAGNLVKENDTTLVTILEMSPIYVSFGLPEQMLAEVRRYQAQRPLVIRASPDDGSTWTSGTLKFFDNTVDPATGTIKMKAEFPNTDRVLWPGQFASVQTQLRVEHDRVVIPSRTVQTGPQGKYVWVMDNNTKVVSMRPVQVLRNVPDPKSNENAVIGQGLRAGELVISEGQMRLAPGMKVNVLPGTAAAPPAPSMGQM